MESRSLRQLGVLILRPWGRTDVYSLGVMLYEIVEGRPPFRESTRAATLQKVIHDPVPPFSSLVRGRPFTTSDRDIERICLKALAMKPGDRHPTAEAFAKELAQWLDKKGSPPGLMLEETRLWSRPRVRIVAASHGQPRKSKLKAVCSSSGRR